MFRSAGLLESGKTMPNELGEILGEQNISTASHRSNQLEAETLEAAELILTMEGPTRPGDSDLVSASLRQNNAATTGCFSYP